MPRRSPFELANWYYEARTEIAAKAERLRTLMAVLNDPSDLSPYQWAQWYAVVHGFRPDLVLELGRGHGNSTALFCEAAHQCPLRIESLCRSTDWRVDTVPRLRSIVSEEWLAPLRAHECDITMAPVRDLLAGAERVLVLWDAHGYDIAAVVLGRILPALQDRPHLVLLHDVSDNRHFPVSQAYEGPLWRGTARSATTARINLGWLNTAQEQMVSVVDFAWRNRVELVSADHEFDAFFQANPPAAREMAHLLGDDLFSVTAHWAALSLMGLHGPFYFPPAQWQTR